MAKRAATTQMTHDNWDHEEEETEDPGEFAAASVDELAQRKIRVAKRRLAGETNKTGSSIFGSFTGFGAKPPAMSTPSLNLPSAPLFGAGLPSFSSSVKPTSSPFTAGLSTSTPVTNKLPDFVTQPAKQPAETAPVDTSKRVKTAQNPTEYYAELKALNGSVIAWMQENYQENPFIDFTPVFNDYKNHFKELEEKHNVKAVPGGKETTDNGTKDAVNARMTNADGVISANGSPSISAISQGDYVASKTAAVPAVSEPRSAPQPFKFGLGAGGLSATPVVPKVTLSAPHQDPKPFTFGIPSTTTAAPSLTATASAPTFAFGGLSSSSTPFSFGSKPPEKSAESVDKEAGNGGGGDEDGEYEPPKPERVEQVEEDAFYNIRCKLFFKKDGKFVEKGVGTLFLKPLDNGKTQLLIRADTATGNILLNVSLNESIPCTRNGKNNVTVVCVPHPPIDPKSPANEPAVLLIRVKTAEQADKLQEEITKAKSGA